MLLRCAHIPHRSRAMKRLVLFAAACMITPYVVAQAPAPAMVEPSKSFDNMLLQFEKQLVPLAEAMPEEKYDFMPGGDMFKSGIAKYEGVRTFRQEITHIAQANYFYGAMAGGQPMNSEKAKAVAMTKTKAELVQALKDSFAYLHAQFATLTPQNAFLQSGRDPLMTRATAAGGVVAHGFDHYGQLVEYLRMNGLVPPASDGKPAANPAKKM